MSVKLQKVLGLVRKWLSELNDYPIDSPEFKVRRDLALELGTLLDPNFKKKLKTASDDLNREEDDLSKWK